MAAQYTSGSHQMSMDFFPLVCVDGVHHGGRGRSAIMRKEQHCAQ